MAIDATKSCGLLVRMQYSLGGVDGRAYFLLLTKFFIN